MSLRSIAAVGIAIAATVAALAIAFSAPSRHTPAFAFKKSGKNVQGAAKRLEIKHPVAQDSGYATWKVPINRYWPIVYLIDKQGRVVYRNYGEGKYVKTETKIQALMGEPSSEPGAQ